MKTKNALLAFFFFFFSFLLFGFITAEYIYDSDGDILNNGGAYYITPSSSAAVEGTSIGKSTSDESCSLAVVQVPESSSNGWPIKVTTTYPLNYITNDYPLNISFVSLPSSQNCTDTPNWVVASVNEFQGGAAVMVGKFEEFGNPISGYFYIKPDKSQQDYYKFAFCYSTSFCGYVVLKTDSEGNQRLAASSDRSLQPYLFKFAKAPSHDVASAGISMVV